MGTFRSRAANCVYVIDMSALRERYECMCKFVGLCVSVESGRGEGGEAVRTWVSAYVCVGEQVRV